MNQQCENVKTNSWTCRLQPNVLLELCVIRMKNKELRKFLGAYKNANFKY